MSDNIIEDTQDSTEVKKEVSQKLNKKKLSFQKLSIHDSLQNTRVLGRVFLSRV